MVLVDDLLREVPPITRIILGLSLIIEFLVYVGFLSKYDIYFSWAFIVSKFQVSDLLFSCLFPNRFGEFSQTFSILVIYQFLPSSVS